LPRGVRIVAAQTGRPDATVFLAEQGLTVVRRRWLPQPGSPPRPAGVTIEETREAYLAADQKRAVGYPAR
jgi:hypothetical protein